jgi:hypothetical protein
MKEYYGNYLGLCINNDDPEKRGRVQIFIPHIMPALFEDWNEVGEDIRLLCVGDNLPDSLPSSVVDKLMKILPWAEAASPILGTSSPGNLISNALGAIGNFFNQSPSSTALSNQGGVSGFDSARAIQFSNTDNASLGFCARGVANILQNQNLGNFRGVDAHDMINLTNSQGWVRLPNVTPQNAPVGALLLFNSDVRLGKSPRNKGGGKFGHAELVVDNNGQRGYVSDKVRNNFGGSVPDNFQGAWVRAETAGTQSLPVGTSSANSSSYETTSTSGQAAALLPHQSPNPFGEGSLFGSIANPFANNNAPGSQMSLANNVPPSLSSPSVSVGVDGNGRVNPAELKAYLEQRIASSRLNRFVPIDGAKYGVDGTPQSWANHFLSLAKHESSFYITATNNRDAGGSLGLFQVSVLDGDRYGANPTGQNWTEQQLRDPINNTNTAIAIYERNVLKTGVIADPVSGKGAWTGSGTEGYFAATSMNKIARDAATGQLGSFDPNALPSQSMSMVNQTDRNGATAVLNINNMAKGVFTYPAAGAILWVFFREGNPLFPVYFAANYGQSEWESAFRQGSDAPGYKPAPNPNNPVVSTGTVANFGVGGWRVEDTTDPTNPSNNQKSFMLYGHDGSNMFFNNGYHQLFSKFDRRDQVEGDRFNTTLGTKEEWIQSDSNQVVMGDQVIKVGNISPDVIQATRRIQDIMKDIMSPLAKSTVTGQNRRPGGIPNSRFTKEAQEKYQRTGIPKGPFNIPAQTVLQDLTNTLLSKFNLAQSPDVGIESVPIKPPTAPASPEQ